MSADTKNPLPYLVTGVTCATVSTFLTRLGTDSSVLDFVQGLLAGLSLPLNIFGLYLFGRRQRAKR
jgi:hypothetical protein